MSGRQYAAVDRYTLGTIFVIHSVVTVASVRHVLLVPRLEAVGEAGVIAGCLLVTAALAALHVHHFSLAALPVRRRSVCISLGAQAVLTFGPMPYFGIAWVAMTSLFLCTALPLCGRRLRRFLPAAGAAVAGADAWWHDQSATGALTTAALTALTALLLALLPHLARSGARLQQAMLASARNAEAKERLLITRDLHDLLAGQLATVVLKGELAGQLLERHDEQARQELHDIVRLTRDSLTEVRLLARRYRDLNLADELAGAQYLLRRAGITVRTTTSEHLPLKCEVATVLGASLREGVTNVLHHSDASVCEIRILRRDGRITLSLGNDRARPGENSSPLSGCGLGNLAARAVGVGGSVQSSRAADGWFRLTVECPLGSPTASPAPGRFVPHPDDSAPLSC